MAIRKFWLNMSIMNFIDGFIFSDRESKRTLYSVSKRDKILSVNLSSQDKEFIDLIFFYKKGIKTKYLIQIFEDFKKFNASTISALGTTYSGKNTNTDNTYSASGQIDVYTHTINCAKRIYEINGVDKETLNKSALFVLIHDIGKISELLKHYSIAQTNHRIASSYYAKLLLVDEEDRGYLEYLRDWLEKEPSKRKFQENPYGYLLESVDTFDRVLNQNKVTKEKR